MAKIIIEIADELKQKFVVDCAKNGTTQRSVVTHLIDKWLKRKRIK